MRGRQMVLCVGLSCHTQQRSQTIFPMLAPDSLISCSTDVSSERFHANNINFVVPKLVLVNY